VERTAESSVVPDVPCLLAILREIVDDGSVNYTVQKVPPGTAHAFTYDYSKASYSWWILVRNERAVTVSHLTGIRNSEAETLPGIRNGMLEVEAHIKNRCGLGKVMDTAHESCRGRACYTIQPIFHVL
jgi:hypothetical protein